jgi:hypothetical protein
MGRTQQVQAKNGKGEELAISTHDTDSPILPVAQIEKLNAFRPDLVDFIVQQTKNEAEFRRFTTAKINSYVFIERMFGMVCALLIGILGIFGGGYVGLHGEPYLGGGIVTAALGTLALAFIKRNSQENPQQKQTQRK